MFEVWFFDRFQPIVCIINRNGQILEFGKVFFDLSMVSLGLVDFAPFEAQIHLVTSIFLDYNCNSEWTRFTRVGFKWIFHDWVGLVFISQNPMSIAYEKIGSVQPACMLLT